MNNISLNQLLANPELYNEENCYGFYDWFCKNSSLKAQFISAIPKIRWLVKSGILDGDKLYVWFKNNCPCNGSLYTDLRFSTLDDNFVFGLCPRTGHRLLLNKASFWILDCNNHDDNGLQEFEFVDSRAMKQAMLTTHREILQKHFEKVLK